MSTDLGREPVLPEEHGLSGSAAYLINDIVAKRKAEQADMRRLAIARLADNDLLRFLDLPEGFEVVGVHSDWERRSVGVMVRSQTLDPVAPGAHPPDVEGSWSRKVYVEEYTGVAESGDLYRASRPWYRMAWSPATVELGS